MTEESRSIVKENKKNWLRNLGLAGFLFFLVKGLIWLALAYFVFK